MPNDPRVKFRSAKVCDKDIDYLRKHPEYLKDHPECRVVFSQHYAGGGGGSSGRLRSIFEDGTPPERPTEQPGGETGGGAVTEIGGVPLAIKPGLDPGGIAGITIASAIAMGAAAALAEHERRRRLNRGIPVPTDDNVTQRSRPNLNRGGTRVPRAISRANGYSQVPIQAEMEAPPAPEYSGIRAAIDTPIARPPAPAAPAPAIQGIRDAINTPAPAPKLPPPPANRPASARPRPTNIRTSAPGIQTPAPLGSGQITPYFDAPLIEMSRTQPTNIRTSAPGIQTPAPLEDIRAAMQTNLPAPPPAAPAPAAVVEDIRAAMQTNLPDEVSRPSPPTANVEDIRAAIDTRLPAPQTDRFAALDRPSMRANLEARIVRPRGTLDYKPGITTPLQIQATTPGGTRVLSESAADYAPERPMSEEQMISILEELETRLELTLAKPPARTQQELTRRRRLRQRLEETQNQLEFLRTSEQRNLINESITRGISTGKITSDRISRNINPSTPAGNNPINDGFNAARQTNIEMQELTPQAHAQQTQASAQATAEAAIDTLQADRSAIAEINRVRTPGGARSPMVDFEADIQELLKEGRATRGSRMFEKAMAGVNERIQRGKATMAELQKMGTRKKIQLTGGITPESGIATLERTRAAGRPMPPLIETEMRGSSLSATGAGEALSATGAVTPQPALELVDVINAEYASLVEQETKAGRPIPEVPKEIREGLNPKMRSQKYIKEEILKRRAQTERPAPAPAPTQVLSEAEALERAIKQSTLEAGLGYTSGQGESSKGVTAETLRAEQPSKGTQQIEQPIIEQPKTGRGKGLAPGARERIIPPAPPPAPAPAPTPAEAPTPATPQQELNEHLKHLEDFHRSVVESYAKEGRPVPEASQSSLGEWATKTDVVKQALKDPANANRTITLESGQEITMEEALGDLMARSKEIKRLTKNLGLSADSELIEVSKAMAETKAPNKSTFGGKKGKLTKKTELLATEEQRLRPTALAGEAQSRVQARAAAPVESRAAAPEMRATAPEARAAAAPAVAAPDVTARRRLGVPELTAPGPAPGEVASFAERRAFFEETSTAEGLATSSRKVKPPTGEQISAPPSAPESGTATPSERPSMEQTPAERALFAEELTGRLKKGPARQKAKINIGKPKTTANPLDIFVSPQHRNLPNTELNPGAKGFKGALTEISSRVPRLVPSRSTLISMGAEGGSMVGGFAAGYFSAQAMNDYFAKHPAKNLGEQYGQALATTFVGMAVGSVTQVVLSQVIRQGVNYALTGEIAAIEGAISGGGTLFLSSIGEAALFTLVGVSTQMATTKFLEDAGFNHAVSRSAGALASTFALAGTEVGLWLAKGGPVNPAGDVSFLASEAMIIGFGIYSFVSEFFEGAKQDEEEEEYQAQLAENQRLNEERQRVIDNTNRRNMARTAFMIAYEAADYDFDKALAAMTPEQRIDLGQNAEPTDPNGLTAFRAQVEAAFDPLLDTSLPEGYVNPAPLSREDQLKRDTYTAYVNWYIDSVNGKNPPPFDFNSEGARLLNDESGGTWTSAANVHATTSITMAHRTNPLIENAQREIVDAFHKDHKTIEEMPPDVVKYADLDPSFRERYNLYIVAEAQSYIYQQYNNASIRYDSMDPRLVAIANRDPEFRGAVDFYYQTLANQARDYNMTIQDAARLNSLAANDQQIEIGKLNDARNKIIQEHQAANQEIVDRYNANILSQLSAYGDNFEAIIRNINDQALLTGHTFLYAANRSDLYRQLHMEMPELELVDPDTGTDEPDAPLPGPSKGRKIGDTDLYGYRYKLTDEQNQELDEQARIGVFADNETQMAAAAAIIYERDRYLFEETDAEKAARENLTLDEYYAKYGIPVEPPIIEWNRSKGNPKEDGKYRFPDGTIETWKNGFRVKVDTTNVVAPPAITKYDPTLSSQPDGQIEMPNGAVRTYSNGLVTSVKYPAGTTAAEMLTPDQINELERPTTTPTEPPVTPVEPVVDPPTYEELKVMYPDTYKNLLRKYGEDNSQIEATLRKAYNDGFNETTGETNSGLTPGGQPVEPITREPTYEELKVMYPDKYTLFSSTYKSMHPQASQETIDKQTELYLKQQYGKNPVPLPPPQPVTPTEPKQRVLFSGDRKMPDGSTRVYVNGKVVGISYPAGFPANQMIKADKASLTRLNDQEGLYYVEVEPTPVTPTQPADPTTLKQGSVKMPDGSTRVYKNGLVIEVSYPPNMASLGNKNPTQINDAEGIRGADWTPQAPVTPVEPVVDRNKLKQGRVTMPDGATRTYIDGLVVSVQYPDGKTGPNINEINASEGVQTGTPAAPVAAPAPAPVAAPAAPAPGNTTAQSLNLAVAPMAAPATTYMPEDTTPGVANP